MGNSIFIYRKGALGDTLSFLPFLFALRKKYSNITFAGNYLYRQIFDDISFITFVDADSRDVLRFFIDNDYEMLNCYEKVLLFSTEKITNNNSSKIMLFTPLPAEKWFYKHPFDCFDMEFCYKEIYLPIHYDEQIHKLTENKPYLVFHPGSGGKKKRLPLELFFKLEEHFKNRNFDIYYLIGESELELINSLKDKKVLVNQSLKKVIFLLSCSAAYFGCDNGVSHLAGLLNLEGVVVFGPSNPEIYKPWGHLIVLKYREDFGDLDLNKIINTLGDKVEKRRDLFSI